MTLTVGSLFSGIGGLELGLERAGLGPVRWQVEQNKWARGILARHWPTARRYTDVREVGAHNLPPVDLICGGFPCQDISNAGKQAGIGGSRSGLWSEFARIIGEIRPRIVLVENVSALRVRGLGRVLGDLAALRYHAEWDCVPASAVGAYHQRDRLFIVAHTGCRSEQRRGGSGELESPTRAGEGQRPERKWVRNAAGDSCEDVSDPQGVRRGPRGAGGTVAQGPTRESARPVGSVFGGSAAEELRRFRRENRGRGGAFHQVAHTGCIRLEGGLSGGTEARAVVWGAGRQGPAKSRLGGAPDGLPPGLDPAPWERGVPRLCGRAQDRTKRLRGLGNAVVPQVAEFIGLRILAAL